MQPSAATKLSELLEAFLAVKRPTAKIESEMRG
jgi:hypothetical protein